MPMSNMKLKSTIVAGIILALVMNVSAYAESAGGYSMADSSFEAAAISTIQNNIIAPAPDNGIPVNMTLPYNGIPINTTRPYNSTPVNTTPVQNLHLRLEHKTNNANTPVEFIIDGLPLNEPITGYTIHFGDGTGWGVGFPPYLSGPIAFSHNYARANYEGYNFTFSLYTINRTYNINALIPVWIEGDANGDSIVNVMDAAIVGQSYGSNYGERYYNDMADLNNDGRVNTVDMSIVQANFGKTYLRSEY